MAQLVLAAAGAAIGGATLGTGVVAFGLTGTAIGWQAGALLGSAFGKKTNTQGPRLGDLRVSGTEYGQPIPWVAGAPRISGQIAWASIKREIANNQKVGKGGSQKVTSYTYEVDLLILLTENPIDGVSRVWSNGELVFNGTVTKSGIWNGFTVYLGDQDQLPDPTYEAAVGAGNAPAYRGHGYVVIQGLQLGQSGQIPNLTFEVRESSVAVDDRIRLLVNWPDSDQDDQSNYQIGGPSLSGGGVVTDGNFRVNYNSSLSEFRQYEDTSLNGGGGSLLPVTYEVLFDVAAFTSVSQENIATFAINGFDTSGGRLPVEIEVSGAGVGANLTVTPQGSGGGTGHPLFYSDPVSILTYDLVHVAIVYYPDSTASLYVCGNRVRNRVSYSGSFSGDPSAGIILGGGTGVLRNAIFDFKGARIARAEVYTGATYTPPTSLTGNLSNQTVTFGEFEKPLYLVIDDLMARAGYAVDDWDTAQIREEGRNVKAMSISQVAPTRSILEQLQSVYFFESAKSDKIYFFPRAASSIATIPFDDLRASSDPDSKDEPLALVTANELEIPAQIALTYPNVSGDYNIATEFSDRIESTQQSTQTLQIPIGLTPSEAKSVSDALLIDQMSSLTSTNIRLPLEYAYIEPGDIVTLTNDDGRQYRMRVQTKNDELMFHSLELNLDDVGALTSSGITDGGYTITEDVRQLADSLWESLDIPLLDDGDNVPGFYVAVTPEPSVDETDWPGAVFARSFVADNYRNEFITGDQCVLGTCQTTLGNWVGSNVFDESNSVTVSVAGQLESTTRAEMLADLSVNMAVVGDELIRFRVATFIQTVAGYNEYRLTGLLRGQRGTEQYQTGHSSNERFVLLNGSLRSVIDQATQIDVASTVKAVTLNLLLSDVTGESFTNTAIRLKPFTVVQLRALADGSDLDITWSRRTRLSYRYGGTVGTSVPLGEASEAYRVRIYDGSTLVRTADVSTNSYTYTAANAASDGFSSGATATIEVVQLSEIVGEGFPAEVEGIIP